MSEKWARSPVRLGYALLVSGILAAAGCHDSDRPQPLDFTVRDSSGVRIVENSAPDPASRLSWTVSPSPTLAIGNLEGGLPEQLFGVADAMRLRDGRVLIANGGSSEVRVFDENGTFMEAWGQRGQGPGEFADLTDLMPWPGDSVMAWDFGQFRLTLFNEAGVLGRTLSPTLGGDLGAGTTVGVLPGGAMLMAGRTPWAGQDPVTGLVRRSRAYALVGPSGEPLAQLGSFPDEEFYIKGTRLAIIRHPFRRLNHTAIWGNRAVVTPSDRYEIRAYDVDGSLGLIVRRSHLPDRVTQDDLDTYLEGRIAEADVSERVAVRELFDGFPLVPTFPAFSQIIVDATGDLWVKEYARPGDDRSVWTVFDAEGHVRGLVETPGGLLIHEIGSDYLLGRATGDFDVEQVQLWGLSREGAGQPGLR